MKEKYGLNGAPRGLVYVPQLMASDVAWEQQQCIWGRTDPYSGSLAPMTTSLSDDDTSSTTRESTKRKERSHSPELDSHKNKVQHVGE